MKKSFLTILIFLVCTIQSSTAYEYFTIYFSDGTKSETFYATDVDSICYSNIGLDGIAYDEWQVQEIYTCDSVYRYLLAQIDSLSFKEVDVNQVAEDIVSVSEAITPLFDECRSPIELSEHLETIKNLNGVDDAYICNQTLFVKIHEWGNISFLYPIAEADMNDGINLELPSRSRNVTNTKQNNSAVEHQHTVALKTCVVNQQYLDENRQWFRKYANVINNRFAYMGMDTITKNMPSPEFFQKEMFDYDILFIKTHGGYDKKNNLHWLLTGEELFSRDPKFGLTDDNIGLLINRIILNSQHFGCSPRKMSFSWIPERRNGDSIHVLYTEISDEYIRSSKRKFRNEGSAIVFNTACESMMENPNMERAFNERGAGCYLGYDDTNYIGAEAGFDFFSHLLVGKSISSAYSAMPDSLINQVFYLDNKGKIYPDKPTGKKTRKCTPKLKPDSSLPNLCVTYPETISAEEISEGAKKFFLLKGGVKLLPLIYYFGDTENGFELSLSSDMKQGLKRYGENEGVVPTYQEPYLNYSLTLDESDLKPNTTYYYRAYMDDGYSNCYGEIMSFTTKDSNGNIEAYYVWKDSTLTFYYDTHYDYYNAKPNQSVQKLSNKLSFILDASATTKVVFDSSFVNFNPSSTKSMFRSFSKLRTIENLKYLNSSNVTDMEYMFWGCSSLTFLDLSGFNTSNVTNMRGMFLECSSMKSLDLSSFNTSNVTNMKYIFEGCSSLTSLNLSSFNTSNVTDMREFFYGCSSLVSLNLC